jgi:hypothetical protein
MTSFLNTPLADTILMLAAFLFGLYEIGCGFHAWRKRIAKRDHLAKWEKWEASLHGS